MFVCKEKSTMSECPRIRVKDEFYRRPVGNFQSVLVPGWQFRIGKIGKIGSASANFPIGRNSVGRAVKFCRKNRGIGKIGGSAKSADRQKSAKTPARAKKRADWMSSGRRLYHTHTFTTPLHQTQTARFFNSQLLLFDWLKLSTACHAQTQYPLTRF